ncbi:GAF domain-containing serine/threonine-protein kinase [Frondihabitans peucedani]|uniref:non-specific serine/threonine protein kinase n=1 Tax=Frondihabitans peucedani TaxID=598626 RepID=A0ABP8E5U6_9MICO
MSTVIGATTTGSSPLLGGRYRLQEIIGRGGMAVVYRAHDESLDRPVAVKVFHAGLVDPARQEAELGVLASLDHHGLVNLLDAGTTETTAGLERFLVMALVTGQDLADRITAGPIASRHIGEIGYDLAEALDYIHSHGVVHRDIKPSNILLVDYGDNTKRARAKLTDFGIALAEDVERLTAEGVTTGTAAFLSPEQARGGEVGKASDVYSLGLVLLQCFTRRTEFPGSLVESAIARLSRDPVIPPELPENWRHALAAMTAQDPAARPVDGELVALLRQVVITESARHRDQVLEEADERAQTWGDTAPDNISAFPDEALQRAAALAARILHAPIAVVSVIDGERTLFRSYFGEQVADIARQISLAPGSAPSPVPVVIHDGLVDPRVRESHLVTGPLGLRFYVGVPLTGSDGSTLGTLSVLDTVPHETTADDLLNLEDLAALVVEQLESRRPASGRTLDTLPRISGIDVPTQAL